MYKNYSEETEYYHRTDQQTSYVSKLLRRDRILSQNRPTDLICTQTTQKRQNIITELTNRPHMLTNYSEETEYYLRTDQQTSYVYKLLRRDRILSQN